LIGVVEESLDRMTEYARIGIGFWVREVFERPAIEALRRGEDAKATPVTNPYWKDYDEACGGRPTDWAARFGNGLTILAAYNDGQRVGGAAVVVGDAELDRFFGQSGAAVLWDLRVAPEARHQGVGAALVSGAERVATRCAAGQLFVETQHINVPACRLYRRNGFRLIDVRKNAYSEAPDEIQLLWAKSLANAHRAPS